MIFGATLNLTPISVLGALVLFMAMWGICGGILSVQVHAVYDALMMRRARH